MKKFIELMNQAKLDSADPICSMKYHNHQLFFKRSEEPEIVYSNYIHKAMFRSLYVNSPKSDKTPLKAHILGLFLLRTSISADSSEITARLAFYQFLLLTCSEAYTTIKTTMIRETTKALFDSAIFNLGYRDRKELEVFWARIRHGTEPVADLVEGFWPEQLNNPYFLRFEISPFELLHQNADFIPDFSYYLKTSQLQLIDSCRDPMKYIDCIDFDGDQGKIVFRYRYDL